MFGRVRNFFSRHRQKIVFGGVFVGGAILLSKYAQKLIREWQERETKELLERTRKQQHYESIERTCNQTALKMAPTLREAITKLVDTEELIGLLKLGVPNKVEVWEQLKILAFTKLSALVYASSMLIMTLRIQLNLVGGYMFHDTARECEEVKITSNLQEKYLGLCHFFMEDGVKCLCELIEEKVKLVLQDRSLKEKVTIHDIEQMFWAIQTSISNDKRDPCKALPLYILPNSLKNDSYGSNVFDNIIVETHDIFESEEISNLFKSCVSLGFSYVTDQIAEFFRNGKAIVSPNCNGQLYSNPSPTTSSTPDLLGSAKSLEPFMAEMTAATIPMAKVIPIVNGLVQSHASKDDVPHMWVQQLILMDSLKVMGANIYETFSSKG